MGCYRTGCASCGTVQFEVTKTYQLYSCFAHVPKKMKIIAVRAEGFQWLQGE